MKKGLFLFLLISVFLLGCQEKAQTGDKDTSAKKMESGSQASSKASPQDAEDCADEDEIEENVFSEKSQSGESLSLEGGGEQGCTLGEDH